MPPKRKEFDIDLPSVPEYQPLEPHEHEATPLLSVPPPQSLLDAF